MRFVSRGREITVPLPSPFVIQKDNDYYTVAMKSHFYPVLSYSQENNVVNLNDHSLYLNKTNRKNTVAHSNQVYETKFRQDPEGVISQAKSKYYNEKNIPQHNTAKYFSKHVFVPKSDGPSPPLLLSYSAPKGTHWTRLDVEDLRKDDHNGEVIVTGWKYGGNSDVTIRFDYCYWRELNWYVILEYENDTVPLATRSISLSSFVKSFPELY